MSSAHILKETRYDAVEVDEDDIPGGVSYKIAVGSREFEVRTSDNEPGGAVVVRPSDANLLPESRELIDFIVSTLGREIIEVHSSAEGRYRTVDVSTLAFKKY